MPLVQVRLLSSEAAQLAASCGPLSSPGRYLASVFRAHLRERRRARARALEPQILAYQPQVRAIARRMWAAHCRRALPGTAASGGAGVVDLEEVEAAVQAELVRVAQRWDPTRGITLGAYAEQWLLAAARRCIQSTWAGELPEPEEPRVSTVDSREGPDLAELPRALRRVAAALGGGRGAVSEAEVRELAQRLGAGPVRLVPLRELAEAAGVAVRTLQARALQGQLAGAVRGRDGRWYAVRATSEACQVSSPASQRASAGAQGRRPR